MTNSADFLPKVKCFGEAFRDAGYTTGYFGKWHLDYPRDKDAENRRFGFPTPDHPDAAHYDKGRDTKTTADEAVNFIRKKSKEDAPWLLMVSWLKPHHPYKALPGYAERYQHISLMPNVPEGFAQQYAKSILPDYYGMIDEIDSEFARILTALDAAGCADNTIVIFTSDHGDQTGSHGLVKKGWPYEESVRTPLLIRYPGRIRPGTVITDPIGAPDLYPTIAGFAGVPIPPGIDGKDFSQYIVGTGPLPRDYVFMSFLYAFIPWPGWRGLRTKAYSYARTKDKPWFLFDIKNDPFQMKNLIDDPAAKSLADEMDHRLTAVMNEIGDTWDEKVAHSLHKRILAGGFKQEEADLGYEWPGKTITSDFQKIQNKLNKKKDRGDDE